MTIAETTVRGGSWLTDEADPQTIVTPERLTDEHRLIAQSASEFMNGEVAPATLDFQCDPAPSFLHVGVATHCPRLKAVQISLVAKSAGSDPTNLGPQARGVRLMNSPVTVNAPFPDTAQYPSFPGGDPHFRRRVQTLRVDLRNYSLPK